jgi:hypothetical protein
VNGLGLISDRRLRQLSIGLGIFFVGLAVLLRLTQTLAPGESHWVLLYPLTTGVALVAAGAFLNGTGLRLFYVFWFAILPAMFWLVNEIGCRAKWFSAAWCS